MFYITYEVTGFPGLEYKAGPFTWEELGQQEGAILSNKGASNVETRCVPFLVEVLEEIQDPDGIHTVPVGCRGLLVGFYTHFDRGYAFQHGKGWLYGELPIYDRIVPSKIKILGEWDGSSSGFTEEGWNSSPIIGFHRWISPLNPPA